MSKELATNINQVGIKTPKHVLAFLDSLMARGYEGDTYFVFSGFSHTVRNEHRTLIECDKDSWIVEFRPIPLRIVSLNNNWEHKIFAGCSNE